MTTSYGPALPGGFLPQQVLAQGLLKQARAPAQLTLLAADEYARLGSLECFG